MRVADEVLLVSDVLKIQPAESQFHLQQVRELFAELSVWDTSQVSRLGLDAQKAMEFYYAPGEGTLPGPFAPPKGRIFLATHSKAPAGCGGFIGQSHEICELKRMYVRPEFRRMQLGRHLLESLITTAKDSGYSVMRLETVTFMGAAIAMYSSFGFKTCQPYYEIPENFRAITVFMELILEEAR
jgi:GNAT superfamily N-acetyltransferase